MIADAVTADLNAVEYADASAELVPGPVSGDTLTVVRTGDFTQMMGRKSLVKAEVNRGR